MAQGKRNRLSTEQRIDMWRRWKAGESLHDIGIVDNVFGANNQPMGLSVRCEQLTSVLKALRQIPIPDVK